MIGFFLDSQMTIPATSGAPKKFLVPLKGGTKATTVYIGDPYNTQLSSAAASGATTLILEDTSEFLSSGQAKVGTQTISYTGVNSTELTGVSGLTANATIGTVVTPLKSWQTASELVIYSGGSDKDTLGISLRLHGSSAFNFAGMPLLLSTPAIATGATPIAIDLQVSTPSGSLVEFTNWYLYTDALFATTTGSSFSPSPDSVGLSAAMNGYVLRRDQQLEQRLRILPLNRSIAANQPGFVWGSYRWRDKSQINELAILPSNWSIDPTSVGAEKFIAGIGTRDDLKPVGLIQQEDSIYLQILRGYYFTGINRYYLPATPQLDFVPANSTTLNLTKTPAQTYPTFVGTYQLDAQGFYEKGIEYRYQTQAAITRGTNLPAYWYTLNRTAKTVTLNQSLPTQDLFIGAISGKSVDYFNIPVYPVGQVLQVYVLAGTGATPIIATNWEYNEDEGTIVITAPSGSGVSVPTASQGMSVFATCTPALAVLYETDASEDTLTVDSVDLNPAFAGLSSGYVYLEHSKQEAASLVLSCDKPLISIPATYSSIIGLVAYGPVYFNGDYALLQAKAYSGVPGEIVSGAKLQVVVDPSTFSGLINYTDPTVDPIVVTTGADGIANLIFTPSPNYGVYIPVAAASGSLAGYATTTISNDTVVLPAAVPISQIWNSTDGWLVSLYNVLNNNPLFGKVGANTSAGEIPFVTSGTAGTANYKMNGYLQPWLNSANVLQPIKALDSSGNNYTEVGFNGNVVRLVYDQSLQTSGITGGYFVTYLQRVLISLQEVDSDVVSNSILLQIQMSPLIDDSIWLTLNDSDHGILNQYRLGISSS